MIENLVTLVSYGYRGYFGEIMDTWESIGVFYYLLPFLIIFSLIFVILNTIHMFKENTAVNTIIALAIGLMAVRFEMVPNFFAEIFPRMGVALGVILSALIVLGIFMERKNQFLNWSMVILSIGAIIVVLYNTFNVYNWGFSAGIDFKDVLSMVIPAAIIIGVIVAVIKGASPDNGKGESTRNGLEVPNIIKG